MLHSIFGFLRAGELQFLDMMPVIQQFTSVNKDISVDNPDNPCKQSKGVDLYTWEEHLHISNKIRDFSVHLDIKN